MYLLLRYRTVLLLFVVFFQKTTAQQLFYSQDFYTTQQVDFIVNQANENIFTAIKPVLKSDLYYKNLSDSLLNYPDRDKIFLQKHKASWVYRKLRKENFIDFRKNNFHLMINPLLWLEYKKQQDDERTFFTNTRGIEFKADLGKRFSFYSSFYENQSRYPDYISDYVLTSRVVPGQGAAKIDNHNPNRYDYSRAEAYISIRPVEKFVLQFGHSKQFIGEGYRSFILSDNSFTVPFFKMSYSFGSFRYTTLWSQYQLFEGAYYNYHRRKYGSINMISWLPNPGFELALTESVMWQGNSPDNPNSFNLNFFNPLLFFRTVQYGLKDEKNILLALNIRKRITEFEQIYGQFALDELKKDNTGKNKYAFQIGIKSFDLLRGSFYRQQLFVLTEYNRAVPYMYAHKQVLSSYSHYNQPLAHSSGGGLSELVAILDYRFRDVFVTVKYNHLTNSLDTLNSNFGSNIFLPDEGNGGDTIGQGIENKTENFTLSFGLIVNPVSNMKIYVEIWKRKVQNVLSPADELYFSFGIKMDINNYYFDF